MRFNRALRAAWVAACAPLLLAGCDILDPTRVENPNTTTEDLAASAEPTKALLPGIKAQMARSVATTVRTTEIVTDNFDIAFSSIGGELGDPYLVNPYGGTYNGLGSAYFSLQELRAFADFVIDSIAPDDENATDAEIAEARYYRGMAFLMQGENFVAVPTGPDQEPTPADGLLELAVADFQAALALSPDEDLEVALKAALARTFRGLGNAAQAESFAQQALAVDPEFVVLQNYSAGEIENPHFGDNQLYEPLPRLDFLDPKYIERDAPIPLGKAEEMHLILAEAAMSRGSYAAGAGHLAEAIALAHDRPMGTVTDNDRRTNLDLTARPRESNFLVRADADSPYRAGLVLTRPGVVTVPTISGTSLDADSVGALTDPEALRHSLWLARQEILFLEGRRLHDLGVLMPVSGREIDASPVIEKDDPETKVVVPSYIPEGTMDLFTPRSPYANPTTGTNPTTDRITITVDMNRVLAEERVSPFGTLP